MTSKRFLPPQSDELEISVFGPGRGECIVVHVPSGPWLVVDSHNVKSAQGNAEPVALAYLNELGIGPKVEAIFLSHWHDDHTAGAAQLIRACAHSLKAVGVPSGVSSREFASYVAAFLPGAVASKRVTDIVGVFGALDQPAFASVQRLPLAVNSVYPAPGSGSSWSLSCVSPSFQDLAEQTLSLRSLSGGKPQRIDVNSGSVAMILDVGFARAVLSSDLDAGTGPRHGWRAVLANGTNLAADIVKVGHHGSHTAYLDDLWAAFSANSPPLAAVTPFPPSGRATQALPHDSMVVKIAGHCQELHLTTRVSPKTTAGKVALASTPFTSFTPIAPRGIHAVGQVRFRMLQTDTAPRVESFPPARRVP